MYFDSIRFGWPGTAGSANYITRSLVMHSVSTVPGKSTFHQANMTMENKCMSTVREHIKSMHDFRRRY
jgi:hypothetical protein